MPALLRQLGDNTTEFTGYDWGDVGWAVVLVAFAAVPLSLSLWALLDAAKRPGWAWALTDRRQAVWMAGIMFGTITVIGGMAISAWYLTKIRPVVAAAESGQIDHP